MTYDRSRRSRANAHYGYPYDEPPYGPGLFRRERIMIPKELILLGYLLRWIWRTTARMVVLAVTHPKATAVLGLAGWIWHTYGRHTLELVTYSVVTVAAVAGCAWFYRDRASFHRHVTGRALGTWRWRTRYRRTWRTAMEGCGLLTVRDHLEHMPQVQSVRSSRNVDVLRVRLATGQTPTVFAGRNEPLAHHWQAHRVEVRSPEPGWVTMTLTRRDPLVEPVTVNHPAYARALAGAHAWAATSNEGVMDLLDAVPVGVTEAGGIYRVKVRGAHVLISGTTGAGKSSLVWAILRAITPLIRSGHVQVSGLDPKFMELAPAADLAEIITDPMLMPGALMRFVEEMDARCRTFDLGRDGRVHRPTVEAPHRIIVIDELATLTALTDKRSREVVDAALGALLSRGRAAGFTVISTTVEPTKDVVRWRGLHLVRVAFRLDEATHTDMALGEGAKDRGAHCELIDPALPGVAFVRVEGDPTPQRIRVVHVTDADILALAATPEPEPELGEAEPVAVDDLATEPGSMVVDLRDTADPDATATAELPAIVEED